MSKSSKKIRNPKNDDSSLLVLGDITLNDFANNSTSCKRSSKKMCVTNITKDVEILKLEEKPWYNQDEDSGDEFNSPMQLNEVSRLSGKRKMSESDMHSDSDDGVVYPIDIWFLISEYIRPEDVKLFALICRTTYYVVRTARFWFTLHRRYEKWTSDLPVELHSWNMHRRGLRSSVIRALFYIYPPFVKRVSEENSFSGDLGKISKAQCILQWQTKTKENYWKYCFKFIRQDETRLRGTKYLSSKKLSDLVQSDSSVHVNKEEGCYILEIVSKELCDKNMVIGEYLSSATLGVTRNLCNHRLKMIFASFHFLSCSTISNRNKRQSTTTPKQEVVLEPVLSVKVYPWWHPRYWPSHSLHLKDDNTSFVT